MEITNLPVLGLEGEGHGVLRLADVAVIVILDLLGALLGLYPIILGESALVASTAGVRKEVRTDRLDGALDGALFGDLADGFEILLSGPSLGEGGKRERDGGRHFPFCSVLRVR